MIFITAAKRLHRNIAILLYPIINDLIALAIGLSIIGFYGKSIYSIRMILEMGIPSLSHLSNIPLFINSMEFLGLLSDTQGVDNIPSITILIVILAVIIGAFLQGGYISYLSAIVKEKGFSITQFKQAATRSWVHFVLLEGIIFLGKIAVTAFLAIFFGIIGVFASFVFALTLRIIFIYLEFSMVVDKTGIQKGMKYGRSYLIKSMWSTLPLVALMYIMTSGLSFLLHYYWSLPLVIGMIILYAYLMTIFQLVLMQTLHTARKGHTIPSKYGR